MSRLFTEKIEDHPLFKKTKVEECVFVCVCVIKFEQKG